MRVVLSHPCVVMCQRLSEADTRGQDSDRPVVREGTEVQGAGGGKTGEL